MANYPDNIPIEQNDSINEAQACGHNVSLSLPPVDSLPGFTARINNEGDQVNDEEDQVFRDDFTNSTEPWIQETCNAVMQNLVIEANLYDEVTQHQHMSCCSNCEKAICCCLSYEHTCTKAFGMEIESKDKIHEAGKFGLKVMTNAASNLFIPTPLGSLVRELIVYSGFIIALAFFINTFIGRQMYGKDKQDIRYEISKLCISSLCLAFLLYNMLHHFCHYQFTTCKQLKKQNKQRSTRCENDDEIGFINNEQTYSHNHKSTKGWVKHCKCCLKKRTTIMDITRLLIVEVLFYTSLLLSIFHFIVEHNVGKVDVTTWLSILFSVLQQLINVYFARIFILAGTVWSIQKLRNKKNLEGAVFHIVFVLYSTAQMFLQVLMIVAIGTRFYIEYEMSANKANYLPSGQLLYMIVFAYFTPAIGMFVFVIVHHYWTQKFLVEVFRDILKIFEEKGESQLIFWRQGNRFSCEMYKIVQYNWQLAEVYRQYQCVRVNRKVFYPFTSPVHVILCLVYIMLFFGFCMCFYKSLPSGIVGWVLFGVILVYGAFINMYAFFVAIVYVLIIAGIILFSVLLLVAFIKCKHERLLMRFDQILNFCYDTC